MTYTDILSIALVTAVVCGLASLLIAQTRQAPSQWVWAVIGFVLGPIGVVFALLAAKPAPKSS